MRPQTQRLGLRLGIVAGANSRAMSIDMALSACCDVSSNANKNAYKKGIVAGHHDEVLSTTSMDVALLCGLRRNALV